MIRYIVFRQKILHKLCHYCGQTNTLQARIDIEYRMYVDRKELYYRHEYCTRTTVGVFVQIIGTISYPIAHIICRQNHQRFLSIHFINIIFVLEQQVNTIIRCYGTRAKPNPITPTPPTLKATVAVPAACAPNSPSD